MTIKPRDAPSNLVRPAAGGDARFSINRVVPKSLVDVRHKLPPLKALTPLRFFAAAYVFLFHIRLQDRLTSLPMAARFVQSGYTGVTFFFLLSEFVLAYNYSSVTSPKSFWIARFARIYPVYLLATVLMLLLNIRQAGVRHLPSFYGESLLVLAMLQAWWPRFAMFLNAAAWTLSVEAFLYAAFPFLAVRFPRLRWRTFLLFELAYLLLVCLPWLMALIPKLSSHSAALADLLEGTIPLVRLNPFLIGIYLGARWRDAGGAIVRSHCRVYLVLGVVGSAMLLIASPTLSVSPLRTLLLSYGYALIVVGVAGVKWRFLTNRWMQLAGEISYGIYILQLPLQRYTYYLRGVLPSPTQRNLLLTIFIIPVCYVVFRWFEMPARLYLRRLLTGRPVATRPI